MQKMVHQPGIEYSYKYSKCRRLEHLAQIGRGQVPEQGAPGFILEIDDDRCLRQLLWILFVEASESMKPSQYVLCCLADSI